jgi:hypothetical protein
MIARAGDLKARGIARSAASGKAPGRRGEIAARMGPMARWPVASAVEIARSPDRRSPDAGDLLRLAVREGFVRLRRGYGGISSEQRAIPL